MRRWLWSVLSLVLIAPAARPDPVARPVEYRHGDTALEGLFVCDPGPGKRPGLLLAGEWAATGPPARQRATAWAKRGYAVFVPDLYGKGVAPKDGQDAAARAGLTGPDRTAVRARAAAGLAALCRQPQVDPKRVGAVGYGVGGTALLELARSGADLEGVACVHGDLSTPNPADGKKVEAAVLALVGTDDPHVPQAQVTAFEQEMRGGGVDFQVVRYGGVGHDFTNPQAGRDLKAGRAYDAAADRRAAEAVRTFLAEVLPASAPAARQTTAARPAGVPEKVLTVLKQVDEHGEPPHGYEGGRTFLNAERLLPQTDGQGRRLKYREWDVNPLRPGVNRGAERLITGSDGSAYYTDDHYRSFKKIR
ncbi:MAG TPA: dienelactone hydrolase family protein [Gemmataceae bacterium]|jgi:dienelactone hydrolase